MPNIAVVDDEESMRNYLKEICLDFYRDKEIMVDCFSSGILLLEAKNRYDLIFLDIELGIDNGIEIARKLREKDKQVQIIIVSGFEKYKTVAYAIHCFDYLDKPVTPQKIADILQEFEDYRSSEVEEDYIILKVLEGVKKIYIVSIRYIEYRERKVFIYTTSATYSLYGKLYELYEQLRERGFGQSHRAYIVNYRKISLIKGREIILNDSTHLPLSKSKKKDFLEQYERFEVMRRHD